MAKHVHKDSNQSSFQKGKTIDYHPITQHSQMVDQ